MSWLRSSRTTRRRGEAGRLAASALALALTGAACGEVAVDKASAGGEGTAGGGGGDAGAQVVPEVFFEASSLEMLRESSTAIFVYGLVAGEESAILRIDKASSAVTPIAARVPDDMAVTDSDVYFTYREYSCQDCPPLPGEIRAAPADGGPVTTLAVLDNMVPKRLAVGGGHIYFTAVDFTAAWGSGLYRIPIAGGAPEVLVPSGLRPYPLAVDPPYVCYVTNEGSILAFDWESNLTEPVATAASTPYSLHAKGGYVYWVTEGKSHTIHRARPSEGSAQEIADGIGHNGYFDVAEAIYFTELGELNGDAYADGRLERVDLTSLARTTLATGLTQPEAIVAGGTHAYWLARVTFGRDLVMRLAKE